MTKSHAQILADIAAKVVEQHRHPLDALREATTKALAQPGAKWTPETGWTDDSICPLCGKNRPLTFESADPNGTINTCESCVTGEDRRIDHTPDWDYELPQEYQK